MWGLEAVKTGVFAPPPLAGAMSFTDLRATVSQAVTTLEAITPEDVNSWSGKDLDIDVFRPVDEGVTVGNYGGELRCQCIQFFDLACGPHPRPLPAKSG